MSETSEEPYQRLSKFVRQRRKELRLTQEHVQQRGGPSSATLRLIESGREMELRGNTVLSLESALGWAPGSLLSILNGDLPTEYEHPRHDQTVGGRPQDDGVLLSMPPEALEGLSPADREEVITAAKLSALQTARAIRRRLDDETQER